MSHSSIKYVPFKCAAPSVRDYVHLDSATRAFAEGLAESRTVPATEYRAEGHSKDDPSASTATTTTTTTTPALSSKDKLAILTKEDLQKYADSEGVKVEQLCRKDACREVLTKVIRNDEFKKIEYIKIAAELTTIEAQLMDSEQEEGELVKQLTESEKEAEALQGALDELNSREAVITAAQKDLKKERDEFAGKIASLTSSVQMWSSALQKAREQLAKAIWRKPGQSLEDETDALSYRSLGEASLTIKQSPEQRKTKFVEQPYDALAGNDVADFNEKRMLRLDRLLASRRAMHRLESESVRSAYSSPGSVSQGSASVAARSLPTKLLSPVKAFPLPCSPNFRVGTSSRSLSLAVGKSIIERKKGRRRANQQQHFDDDVSVGTFVSALTSSTHALSMSSSSSPLASGSQHGGGNQKGSPALGPRGYGRPGEICIKQSVASVVKSSTDYSPSHLREGGSDEDDGWE